MSRQSFIVDDGYLICNICNDLWLNKDPRMLSCQHTYCFECLEMLCYGHTFIKCPTCKKRYIIPQKGVLGFSKHLMNDSLSVEARKDFDNRMV